MFFPDMTWYRSDGDVVQTNDRERYGCLVGCLGVSCKVIHRGVLVMRVISVRCCRPQS